MAAFLRGPKANGRGTAPNVRAWGARQFAVGAVFGFAAISGEVAAYQAALVALLARCAVRYSRDPAARARYCTLGCVASCATSGAVAMCSRTCSMGVGSRNPPVFSLVLSFDFPRSLVSGACGRWRSSWESRGWRGRSCTSARIKDDSVRVASAARVVRCARDRGFLSLSLSVVSGSTCETWLLHRYEHREENILEVVCDVRSCDSELFSS